MSFSLRIQEKIVKIAEVKVKLLSLSSFLFALFGLGFLCAHFTKSTIALLLLKSNVKLNLRPNTLILKLKFNRQSWD